MRHVADELDDLTAGHAVLPRWRAGLHDVNYGGSLLDAALIGEDEADAAEYHVHYHAGGDDRHALPDRLVLERTRVVIVLLVFRSLADHLDVPAQWNPRDLVERFALSKAKAGNGMSKAETEHLDVNV